MAFQIRIDSTGLATAAELREFAAAVELGFRLGLAELARALAAEIRRRVPVRTGTTRRSVVSGYDRRRRSGYVKIVFPASLWWRRLQRAHPRINEAALNAWVRQNAHRIVGREIRRAINTQRGR